MNTHTNDWLLVSTDGFAQQNSARPREHLVKELLQNGLDSLTGLKGRIELAFTAGSAPETLLVTCRDTGCGIDDMETIRTVFWTSKQDSPLKRGRMGRGFKESLCLALHCEVVSKGMVAIFSKSPTGERLFSVEKRDDQTQGTLISMLMPWDAESTIPTLEAYFGTFLPPKDITVTVNGSSHPSRQRLSWSKLMGKGSSTKWESLSAPSNGMFPTTAISCNAFLKIPIVTPS